MDLKQITPELPIFTFTCIKCGMTHKSIDGYADLDGTPFNSYWCKPCALNAIHTQEFPEHIKVDRGELSKVFDRVHTDQLVVGNTTGGIDYFNTHADKWDSRGYTEDKGFFYILPPSMYGGTDCCVGYRYGVEPENYISFSNLPVTEFADLAA